MLSIASNRGASVVFPRSALEEPRGRFNGKSVGWETVHDPVKSGGGCLGI